MRALSLSQPWASIVVAGPKRIENRPLTLIHSASKRVGEVIGLHAAKSWDHGAAVNAERHALGLGRVDLPRGAMIGTGRVLEVLLYGEVINAIVAGRIAEDQRRWTFGPLCIVLGDVRALPAPVECRGMLGFWTVPAAIATLLEELAA